MNGGGTKEYASQNIVAKLGDFGLSSVLCGPYQVSSTKTGRMQQKTMTNRFAYSLSTASFARKDECNQPKMGSS